MSNAGDQRNRQIVWAAVILIGIGLVVSTTLLFGRKLPGLWGEWASTLIGVMTTPFLMEASFVNHVAAERSGDEWVDPEVFESVERDQNK
jgi:hypothetical protein